MKKCIAKWQNVANFEGKMQIDIFDFLAFSRYFISFLRFHFFEEFWRTLGIMTSGRFWGFVWWWGGDLNIRVASPEFRFCSHSLVELGITSYLSSPRFLRLLRTFLLPCGKANDGKWIGLGATRGTKNATCLHLLRSRLPWSPNATRALVIVRLLAWTIIFPKKDTRLRIGSATSDTRYA
jgi:hypothetical protein